MGWSGEGDEKRRTGLKRVLIIFFILHAIKACYFLSLKEKNENKVNDNSIIW